MFQAPITRRRARIALAAVAAVGAALLLPTSAAATAGDPVGIVFSPATTTIEYGEYWEITAQLTNTECVFEGCDTDVDIIVESPENGEVITTPIFDNGVFLSGFDLSFLLPPGTYEIRGQMTSDDFTMDDGNTPASLVISPAALAVEANVIPDEHQPNGAIVSAELTGDYVTAIDECFGSSQCHPPLPNGSWKLTMRNSSGETLHEETIATKGNGSRYVSYYWHGLTAASDYTVDVSFTPTTGDVPNYSVEPAQGTAYRSADAPDAGDPDAPFTPDVEVETAASPTLPLWLVISMIVLIIGLAATAVVFWVLLRRRRAGASAEPEDETTEGGPA